MAGNISYRHPEWVRRFRGWEFARVSYVGGTDYTEPANLDHTFLRASRLPDPRADGSAQWVWTPEAIRSLLYRHARETDADYQARNQRAVYYNVVQPIISELVATALRQEPERRGDKLLEDFWAGADQERARSLTSMLGEGAPWGEVYGINHACVDIDPAPGGDGKPYLYWVDPIDVMDWSVDEDGNYRWLKVFVYADTERKWTDAVLTVYRYRIWYPDRVETWQADDSAGAGQRLVKTDAHGFGVVPFVAYYAKRNPHATFPDGKSRVLDIFKASNRVFNLLSLLDEIFYKQAFSQLVIPDTNIDATQTGLSYAICYDGKLGGEVKYISPDADQPRVLMEGIGAALEQIRSSSGFGRGASESSKQAQSGDAIELESESKKTIVADVAGSMEDFEKRLAAVLAKIRRATASKAFIKYPREFDLRSFAAVVADATSFQALSVGPAAKKLDLQGIVKQRFRGLPPDELKALVDAVPEPVTAEPLDNGADQVHLGDKTDPANSGDGALSRNQGNRRPVPSNRGEG